RQILLGVLVGVAALVAYQVAWPRPSAEPPSSSSDRAAAARTERAALAPSASPTVQLHALQATRPKPLGRDRNLFRFKPKPPPPPPPVVRAPVAPPPLAAEQPPPPPRLPPITYRFIGIVEAPERAQRIAVLTDGVGPPLRGREGDLVEGRYRILRIGSDTIEMAYADGRGRQTIRLTGS
ncbi:MAG: hypothetical protein A3G76_02500, partial [Acidobacteria bacterium RIFCSPLOWO2_12_FULL_65_11]